MADKKVLDDSEISKVSGGFRVPYKNWERMFGPEVTVDSNDPKCPYCSTPLVFFFTPGIAHYQKVYGCEKCCVGFVRDELNGVHWYVDKGTES